MPRYLERRGGVDLVTVPIVTLDASAMRSWAGVVSGFGNIFTPGRTFDLAFLRKQTTSKERSSRSPQTLSERTAQERVALFRSTASKTACQLANLMAATPVSLPVIDLLRDAFRGEFQEEVQQSHVAEVLLSGILRRCDTEEDAICRYEFWGDSSPNHEERVRDILLGDASISKTLVVLDVLAESICRRLGRPSKSFMALLSPKSDWSQEATEAILPFAQITTKVLHRLGGEYAKLAQLVESYEDPKFPALEAFTFTTAQLVEPGAEIWHPPLHAEEFTVITFQLELEQRRKLQPFEFDVATVVKRYYQWEIQRQQSRAYQFIEQLPDNIPLEMVSIPAGTFLMGSSENEADRSSRESSQHEVNVGSFFMGRYPITQAQWRVVSAMPPVARDLNPEPSHFKGDNRPVEQVRWYEAVEFCDRLSKYTSRPYRLPSEAEWEYACRAGTQTPFHFGETITAELANYDSGVTYRDELPYKSRGETTPVDQFPPNQFGLSDMHGNVLEWCQDHWHTNYDDAPKDGSAWITEEDSRRVCRGGAWGGLSEVLPLRLSLRLQPRLPRRQSRFSCCLLRAEGSSIALYPLALLPSFRIFFDFHYNHDLNHFLTDYGA